MNVSIPQEEYNRLMEEARAWRYHVRSRLRNGQVEATYQIVCVSGDAMINVSDPIIVTPFGNMKVTVHEGGSHDYALRTGDSINLTNLVQLRIN